LNRDSPQTPTDGSPSVRMRTAQAGNPMTDKPDGKRGFVVRATGATGTVCWLSAANEDGFRALTSREHADVFQTFGDAYEASIKLPGAFADTGLLFSVESDH